MKLHIARTIFCFVTFTLASTNVFGQASEYEYEYGRIEELRGVDRFFVDAAEDLDLRNIIRDILEKELEVAVVERSEDADHVISFRWVDAGNQWRGYVVVAKRLSSSRLRVLSNYRGSETELNDLADEYAKWLVKQVKRAVREKPAG
jgi:hypothetical protein